MSLATSHNFSLTLRPMSVVFGLGARPRVRTNKQWTTSSLKRDLVVYEKLHTAHPYKIRIWHPMPQTAANQCCELFINLKQWCYSVVVELDKVISISFMLIWQWAFEPFRYYCWIQWSFVCAYQIINPRYPRLGKGENGVRIWRWACALGVGGYTIHFHRQK